jgi:hypothetical protein
MIKINATNVVQSGVKLTDGNTIPFGFLNGSITVNADNLSAGHNTVSFT